MSWLYPTHVKAKLERFEAALAESGEAHEQAQKVASEIAASTVEDRKKIEATRREIRRRSDQRLERQRHRADQEPGLAAAIDALKLLERRH
ncbi:hypothetical protein [Methylobacterium fujisawaense]|uniref:hypothetical protein n=1 Tax=Methylobacterium fujisawaense TaxID=107400 RepID=UPI00313AC34F